MDSEIGSNRLAMLAAEIRGGLAGEQAAKKERAKHAIAVGRALVEAKLLLKHGRWLPWLKEHCALSDRSAQLYMGIVADADDVPDEVLTALISVFGLRGYAERQRAAKQDGFPTAPVMMGPLPDRLAGYPEPVQREWLAYGLLTHNWDQAEWLMRQGWASPDDWLSDNEYRKHWGMREPSEQFLSRWATHKAKHASWSREQLEAALSEAIAA